ncbi:unnamed protein product [Cylicocyclus nassatus]|uniref:Uncharacterized protein n=1 Tax=Cylicocyclus nassatus TaxID=53992 RepID=A0AA36H659_CYLNA|nr:unnamed protein product [Cylicocyclus nassatus]
MNGQKKRASTADSLSSSNSSTFELSTNEAQVTKTSAVMATAPTQQKRFSSSSTEFDSNTDAPVTIALARATVKPSDAQSRSTSGLSSVSRTNDDDSTKDEVITVHRLWEDFLDFKKKVERHHQDVQEWMQSMKRATFTTQERTNTSSNREMIHTQQKKSPQETSHKKPQSSEKATQPKNERRRRHFKDHRHLRKSFATSQKKSSTATSLQKESESEEWRDVASESKGAQKGKERKRITVNGQRRQVPPRGKEELSQKRLKKRTDDAHRHGSRVQLPMAVTAAAENPKTIRHRRTEEVEGIVLPRDAARPISAHSRKTNPTVQIDESPQKATREAVMAHPDGPGLRRRSTQTAPLKIDNGEAFIADKQDKTPW